MPKYQIELSDGRKFEVEADGPPSEQDVLGAIGKVPSAPAQAAGADSLKGRHAYTGMLSMDPKDDPPIRPLSEVLPMVGAALATGGLGAGAGIFSRIAAAGLGAAGGEGIKQLTNAATGGAAEPSAGRILSSMGTTGVAQGMLPQAGTEGVGRLLKWAAPHLMDMGLQRTKADRLEFPNTPQRLVDDKIIPRGTNVQDALSATEAKISGEAQRFDAQRPTVRGYLPEAREAVPLGTSPRPQGGVPAVTPADSVSTTLDKAEQSLGPAQARLVPERLLPQSRQYFGDATGSPLGDVVSGHGTVLRAMDAAPGRGAPPTMASGLTRQSRRTGCRCLNSLSHPPSLPALAHRTPGRPAPRPPRARRSA